MLTLGVSHIVAVLVYLDIAPYPATLLHDGRRHDVDMGVRFRLVEVDFKADDVLLSIFFAHEIITVNRPLLDVLCSCHTPVMPPLRIPFVVHLLVTESQLLHLLRAARKNQLDVCKLLIRGTRLVLLETYIM